MLINTGTLHNNTTLPLIITNSSDNEVCIPKEIGIGTSKEINSGSHNINEIALSTSINNIKIDERTHAKPVKLNQASYKRMSC